MKTIGIIGSGSYCTSLIKIISENIKRYSQDIHICWFVRKSETKDYILNHKHNPNYLSSVELHLENIEIYTDINKCIQNSEHIILGIPSAYIYNILKNCDKNTFKDKTITTVIKGVIPETNEIVADYLKNSFSIDDNSISMITGPSHAEEIALEKLTYLTIASSNEMLSASLAKLLSNDYIKTILSTDLKGAEYASILKNVFAIAAGIYHGLGYGDNFHAFFMTNAIKELKKFVNNAAPIKRDIEDSAYLGDLLVTCYSVHSRNRTFGNYIGKGYSVKAAQAEMNMVAEGYFAAKCMFELNKNFNIDLPILDAVYQILYNHANVGMEMQRLTAKLN
ncbi:MAG: NAD(P)H-dependent glycerol-3-phosphate dehydrogenase [Bacteroidota bacterium]|jgi:glycerol-3-phosphate dehydrogenase (NAD(P)+)